VKFPPINLLYTISFAITSLALILWLIDIISSGELVVMTVVGGIVPGLTKQMYGNKKTE
jgi:hypothetical protein